MNTEQGFTLHPGAAQDITDIWEFILEDNPLAARRVRENILDAVRKLVPFPHQGHSYDPTVFHSGSVVQSHLPLCQIDGQNLTNVLDVIDFGGLFSGNAIGPPQSYSLRLTTSF
jgi:plasmid stabilization system protein ParE